jgi:hypothetical protein
MEISTLKKLILTPCPKRIIRTVCLSTAPIINIAASTTVCVARTN